MSEYKTIHPLNHVPFSRTCWRWYGGPRQHLYLWWDLYVPDPIGWIMCRLGRHEWGDWFEFDATQRMCKNCFEVDSRS